MRKREIAGMVCLFVAMASGVSACTPGFGPGESASSDAPIAWKLSQDVSRYDDSASVGNWFVYEHADTVRVINAETGKQAWQRSTGDGRYWVGDKAIVTFPEYGNGELAAYDIRDGKRLWKRLPHLTDEQKDDVVGTFTSDTLVMAYDKGSHSRDEQYELIGTALDTGKRKWHRTISGDDLDLDLATPASVRDNDQPFKDDHKTFSTMTDTDVVYVNENVDADVPKETLAIDISTGKTRWKLRDPLGRMSHATLRTIDHGRILSMAEDDHHHCSDLKIDIADPSDDTVVSETVNLGYQVKDGAAVKCDGGNAFPLYQNSLLGQARTGRPQVVDLRDGKPRWTATRPGQPVGIHGRIVLSGIDHKDFSTTLTATDIEEGKTLWKIDDVGPLIGNDAVAGDTYLSSGRGVTAYDLDSGKRRWRLAGELVDITDDYYICESGATGQLVAVKRSR
ncbi:MAG TPA: PQQ-binding-like beta-propeller repeat protein [Stackebrandtia sp.]|jgi:outer membrane protein assembly factor BamB|uniref:outer membrane protein assembly factor BamB family protein n=1 Tax=Stackebrandtia sp. TaxID=2023065 RepID=UPI002D407F06|nr:PQQ-binding-like beta-propeller repeat protein [Stackebrandtia sp.]HZE37952.1 PQQ-binding-like beta-propeller repeat protein [Stackebrandtia sp.]